MKGEKRQPSGYTIIEVLIVLAVSGIVFLAAASFISGKQARTSFKSGVGEMASQIEDVIQQVNDGHFTDKNFNCTPNDVSGPSITTGSNEQGTNSGCVFAGKFIRFQISPDPASYQVYQLAGNRLNGGQPATTLDKVLPVPVMDSGSPHTVDLTLDRAVPQHLSVLSVTLADTVSSSIGVHGFGIVQGFGSTSATDPDHVYTNGSQSVSLMEANNVDGTSEPRSQILSSIAAPGYSSRVVKSVTICITDDTRYAKITVGENSNQLGVSVTYVNVCS